jgi:small subunit ribosomal protein S4
MGDPGKTRKTYRTPSHPWNKQKLIEEDELARTYGLKSKKEIWKMDSILQDFKHQSKKLVAMQTKQSELEKDNLIKKLKRMGLLKETQGFDDILGLTVKDVMERRLATLLHRKGLAKTMRQARQFIVYGHVNVGNKEITSPSYLVRIDEEALVGFNPKSSLSDPNHAERVIQEKKPKKERRPEPKYGEKKGKGGRMDRRRPRREDKR